MLVFDLLVFGPRLMKIIIITIAAVLVFGCSEQPAFHKAASRGNIEAVKKHLELGEEVNLRDDMNRTPLHHAAFVGSKEIVELLIARGADVNATNDYGSTSLHYAAIQGHTKITELLISNAVDLNLKRVEGFTPLHLAARKGRNETVKLLIAKGADINATNELGLTPFQVSGNKAMDKLFREHVARTEEELENEDIDLNREELLNNSPEIVVSETSPEDVAKEVELIEKALEAGEISEKEADARIEKLLGNEDDSPGGSQENVPSEMSPEDVAKEVELIEKALEAGEISEKEADARIEKLLGN